MKKYYLIIVFLALALSMQLVLAQNSQVCNYGEGVFEKFDGTSIEENGLAKKMFGSDTGIKLTISDENSSYYYLLEDYIVSFNGGAMPENVGFIVTLDSCTLKRINEGGDILQEYEDKNIEVKGTTGGKKTKMLIGKVGFWFYKVFN
ncbi:MAG: hypothetical protein ACP5N2_04635 [Candidatus Nanoarchaeia archaeon]